MTRLTAALVLLTIFTTSGVATAQPKKHATEIQIFLNYRGVNKYKLKVVSTTNNAVSAWYLYNSSTKPAYKRSAACYKGDPLEAIKLLQTMMDIFDDEYHRKVQVFGQVVPNPSFDEPGLNLFLRLENGKDYLWFAHMRECIRWSTHEERWPEPEPHPPAGSPSPIPLPTP